MMTEKITFFSRYAENGASSRLRQWRWRDPLAKWIGDIEVTPFFSAKALRTLYASGHYPAGSVIASCCRRCGRLIRKNSPAVIEYELLPGFPAWIEQLLLRRTRYILDFDDDVWTKYEKIPFLCGKYDALIRNAAGVTVANCFLLEKVKHFNANVLHLPTPIDNVLPPSEKFPVFTLAWIGSPTTRRAYLEPFAPVLRELAKKINFELLVIADRKPELPGVPLRFEAWSETNEALLARCHVGIMPLADDAFARGKSAYKLIQYLGAGIPAVASEVGENRFVLKPGKTGFFAATAAQWCEAVSRLAADDGLCKKMSDAARNEAKHYLRSALSPRYRDFLCRTLNITPAP